MFSSPNTEVGRIQSEVNELKRKMQGKVDDHEIHNVNRRLSTIEYSLSTLNNSLSTIENSLLESHSELEDIKFRLIGLENNIREKP